MKKLIIPITFALALLFNSCATYNFKTVETVPVGENEATLGLGLWLMYFKHNPEDEPVYEVNEDLDEGPEKMVMPSINFAQRFGVFSNLEIGYSIDGLYWPGIGGKVQIFNWFAIDGNLKLTLPVYDGNPPTKIFYDASVIFGGKNFYFGTKYLPYGVVAHSDEWYEQDIALFTGYKFVYEEDDSAFIPEILYYVNRREFAVGFGIVF
jgi:hypothetical protein